MPRSYKRISTKCAWSIEDLKLAIKSVKEGSTIRGAARRHGIPESTLRDKLKEDSVVEPRMGKKPTFTMTVEKELAIHLITLSRLFYGLTPRDVRRLALSFAEANNIKNKFNKNTGLAGPDWFRLFLRRNPEISLRRPESTSISRITAFNPTELKIFYDNIATIQDKYSLPNNRIFNMDETGITNVQKPPRVLASKGTKQLGAATSGERGRTVTVICSFSVSGIYVPPFFIYPRKRMTTLLEKGGITEAKYTCSKNGWINEELFLDWLEHFRINVNTSIDNPVLLVLDNHSSHISLKSYEFCKTNGILMVTIPPHTSHKLQPLDLTFYGPLKISYNKECSLFLRNHAYQKISMYDMAEIFKNAYLKVASLEKAISGFSVAGIYPFNPDKFNEFDFNTDVDNIDCQKTERPRPPSVGSQQPELGPSRAERVSNEPQPGTSGVNTKSQRKVSYTSKLSNVPQPRTSDVAINIQPKASNGDSNAEGSSQVHLASAIDCQKCTDQCLTGPATFDCCDSKITTISFTYLLRISKNP